MALKTWNANKGVGSYYDPTGWAGGQPGPGDTEAIGPVATAVGDADAGVAKPAAAGALIDGVTINLSGATIGARLRMNHNVLGSGTVINATGNAALWMTNVNLLDGQINVGVGATTGTLELDLFPHTDPAAANVTLADANLGKILVSDGSELYINPFTGGGGNGFYVSPYTGFFNFLNTGLGTITLAPGATLLDQSPVGNSGYYNTDFINDGTINVLGAAGKKTTVTFNANVRSSTSFVNSLDTPDGKSVPASGNTRGVINVDGGAGSASVTFTGNESDQIIRAHSAAISFSENETTNQPRAWGGEIDLLGNAGILVQPNYLKPSYPIGAVPGDPDYTSGISLLGPVVHGFDSTDSLSVTQEIFNYAFAFWDPSTHKLSIRDSLNATFNTTDATQSDLLATFTLDGNWQQSDFKVGFVSTGVVSGYWQVTTTNDSNSPGAPLFNRAYYLANNPDVAKAGVDPYQHYLTTGWKEGRNPSALFDTNYYLAQNPGVKAAGVNPLVHFEQAGWLEGRDPSAAFSVSRYEAANPTVRAAGANPLLDYLTGGQAAGRAALPVVAGPAPAYKFLITDSATGTSGGDNGTAYTGPTAGLQQQYLWASPADAAITATVPNVFLRGGTGNDALQVQGGTNVLDGGAGSNFLTGGTGADGGTDTFFVDGRGGASTWSTIANFHHGDSFTLFGFNAGTSTRPWTALDGAAGHQGATIHSELGGAGTGVNGSVTFAGISLADAQAKFAITTGTVGGSAYLSVAYTG